MDDQVPISSFQGLGLDSSLFSTPTTPVGYFQQGITHSPLSGGTSSPRSPGIGGSPLSHTDGVTKLVRPSPRSRLFSLAQRESSGASTYSASASTGSSRDTSPHTLLDVNSRQQIFDVDKRNKSDGDLTEYLTGFSHLLNAIYQAKDVCNQELNRISQRLIFLSDEISRYNHSILNFI
jgi:hypothetical protein